MPRWEASLAAKGLDFQKSPSSDFIWRDLSRLRRSRPLVASLQRSLPHKQWDNQRSNETCDTFARIGHVYLHSHTATEKTELGVKQRRTNMDGILHSSCTASQASIHFSDVSETNSHGTLDPKRICRAK